LSHQYLLYATNTSSGGANLEYGIVPVTSPAVVNFNLPANDYTIALALIGLDSSNHLVLGGKSAGGQAPQWSIVGTNPTASGLTDAVSDLLADNVPDIRADLSFPGIRDGSSFESASGSPSFFWTHDTSTAQYSPSFDLFTFVDVGSSVFVADTGTGAATAYVPEPTGLALLVLPAAAILRRRQRD
jgi:hypothetical protein